MTQVFSSGNEAGYCTKCNKGYAVGPHVCKTADVARPSKELTLDDVPPQYPGDEAWAWLAGYEAGKAAANPGALPEPVITFAGVVDVADSGPPFVCELRFNSYEEAVAAQQFVSRNSSRAAHEPPVRQCNHGAISPKGTMFYHGFVSNRFNQWRCDVCRGIYEGNLTEPMNPGSQALTLVSSPPPPPPSRTQWRVAPGDETCVFTGDIATPIKFFSKERAAMVVAAVNAYSGSTKPGEQP